MIAVERQVSTCITDASGSIRDCRVLYVKLLRELGVERLPVAAVKTTCEVDGEDSGPRSNSGRM